MAEILIQRKRRRSVWPWLLGLVVLALLPLPFLANRGERQQVASAATRRDTTARAVAPAADSVAPASDSGVTRPSGGTAVAAAPGASAGRPRSSAGVPTASASAVPRTAERTTATSAGTIAPVEGPPPASATTKAPAPAATRPAAAPPTSGVSTAPSSAAAGSPSIDASFSRYTATTKAPTNERAHREYTAEALDRLAAELRALGASAAGVAIITAHADSLRMPNARSAARPDYARAAFLGAVHQFDLLRARNRSRVNVARLRSAAWAIDPRRQLVVQRATVERFFAAARDALDSLSRRG